MEILPISINSRKKIFKNFNFLAIGKLVGDGFSFLLFVVLSRIFGEEGIGQYSFAIAFTGFFVVFAEFGLYFFSIKELNRTDHAAWKCFETILSLRLMLSSLVFVILLGILVFLPFSSEIKVIIVIIGAYQIIFTLVDGFAAVFVAREHASLAGVLESSLRIITALAGIIVAVSGGGLVMVLTILPLLTCIGLFIAYKMVVGKYGKIQLNFSLPNLIDAARHSFPYAQSSFLYPLASRVDVVFLGFFLGAASAGIYNVAYRLIFFLQFFPYFAGVALLPFLTRLALDSKNDLSSLYRQGMNLIVLVGLPVAAGVWLIAPDLMDLAFGPTFSESARILRILTGLLFLCFLEHVLATFLMACNRQSERMRCQWGCAWANVGGNLFLIPVLGIYGAAIATVASEALLVFLYVRLLVENIGWPNIGRKVMVSMVGVAGMCAPFLVFPSISQILMIPAAIVCYLAILASFRDIRRNEWPLLLSLFRRNPETITTSDS
jgi:O-antigen/teichoic acid export membrane protein